MRDQDVARCDAGGCTAGSLHVRYRLHHHEPHKCGVVFATFKGYTSPLRDRATLASCRFGGHAILWTVDTACERAALALLSRLILDPEDQARRQS